MRVGGPSVGGEVDARQCAAKLEQRMGSRRRNAGDRRKGEERQQAIAEILTIVAVRERIGRLDLAVGRAARDGGGKIVEVRDRRLDRPDRLHFGNERRQIVAECSRDCAALLIERPHDAHHARRHPFDVEGKIAAPRFDPRGAQHGARRMQHHVHVGKAGGEDVGNWPHAGKQLLRGGERRLASRERGCAY